MNFRVKEELLQLFRMVGATGEDFTFLQLMDYLKEYIKLNKLYDPADPVIIDIINDPLGKIFKAPRFSIARAQALLKTCLLPVPSLPAGWMKDNDAIKDSYETIWKHFPFGNNKKYINSVRLCYYPDKGEPKTNDEEPEKQEVARIKRKESGEEEPPPKRVTVAQSVVTCPVYIDIVSASKCDNGLGKVLNIQGRENAGDESFVDDDDDVTAEPENGDNLLSSANSEYDSLSMLPSDEDCGSSLLSDNEYSFEYEVSSVNGSVGSDSDTGSTIFTGVLQLNAAAEENDVEFWADLSNCEDFTSDDCDPDITDCDKWLCKKCNCFNWPTMRFCQKCWQLRVNWLPEQRRRPPKRLRRKRRRSKVEGAPTLRHVDSVPGSSNAELLSLVIKASVSSDEAEQSSQATLPLEELPNTFDNQSLSSNDLDHPASSQGSSKDSTDSLCILCLQRPRNASLIHGTSAHMLTCYHCAQKLWQQGQPCPACRRKVQKIVRMYMH